MVMTLKNLFHLNILTLINCITLKYLTNKSLSLFHINVCSLNKIFYDLQHLLIIAIGETRITKMYR